MVVSEEALTKAIEYLAETDTEEARLWGYSESMKDLLKPVYGAAFSSTTGPQEQRKAEAYDSEMYRTHLQRIDKAREEHREVQNKRITNTLKMHVWQSENANRRAGVIL